MANNWAGPAAEVDITIEPGADFKEVFDYSALIDVDGAAFNFSSGWTGAAQVRRTAGPDGVLLLTLTVAITATLITLTAAASATEDVTSGGVWDLELTKTSGGNKIRMFRGRARLSKEVTQP